MASDGTTPRRSARLPVRRTERVVLGALAAGPRRRLEDRLYELWREFFVGMSRDEFVRTHLFDGTRLVMAFGQGGDLAGFVNINTSVVRAGGRDVCVFTSGAWNRLEYRSSATLGLAAFGEYVGMRRAYPGLPIRAVTLMTNPVVYDFLVRQVADASPLPGREPSTEALEIVREVARMRALPVDPADPWVVRFTARSAQAERLLASEHYRRGSPAMRWFVERVPDWAEGRALMICLPVVPSNMAAAIWNLLRERGGRKTGR